MANSIESRPALLDHTVAEAAVRASPEPRIKDFTEKWVQREAIKGLLSELLHKRQMFAFTAPPAHTDRRKRLRIEELITRFLADDARWRAGLFDPAQMAGILGGIRADGDPRSLVRKDAILNHLPCPPIVHEQFIEQRPSPPRAPS